jgi:argininosuccinate lyase
MTGSREEVGGEVGPPQEGPAPELVEAGFALEIADAPLLHAGLNLADMAHVLALHHRQLIPPEPARRLLRLLLEVHRLPAHEFPYDAAFGDAYNSRERYFIERLGTDAGWLHAGRPRREAGRVALRLHLRRLITGLVTDLAGFVEAISDLAAAQAETVMPDQTYLQQAQPSTFGHYALTFAYPALRDCERLLRDLDWVNRSPGGAGCVNGSRLALDRELVAEALGFDGVIEHTRDAMWQTDGLIDLLATAASVASNLSKLAEDLEIWDSQEFDFVELAGPYTRASVLMPQKRNPYALSIVRGATGVLIGRLSGFLAVVKTPSARSDNLIFAYGEVPRSLEMAGKVTRLMRGVVATLRVNRERMWEALLQGFSQATDLAEYVMQTCDLDYRSAAGPGGPGAAGDGAGAGRARPLRGARPPRHRAHPPAPGRGRARPGTGDGRSLPGRGTGRAGAGGGPGRRLRPGRAGADRDGRGPGQGLSGASGSASPKLSCGPVISVLET